MLRRMTQLIKGVCASTLLALILTTTVQAQEYHTYDEVYAYAANAFGHGPTAHYVTRIAKCESNWRPAIRSSGFDPNFRNWRTGAWGTPYDFVGLMQVDYFSHVERMYIIIGTTDRDALQNPWLNMLMAADIQREQGWGAWPHCKFS